MSLIRNPKCCSASGTPVDFLIGETSQLFPVSKTNLRIIIVTVFSNLIDGTCLHPAVKGSPDRGFLDTKSYKWGKLGHIQSVREIKLAQLVVRRTISNCRPTVSPGIGQALIFICTIKLPLYFLWTTMETFFRRGQRQCGFSPYTDFKFYHTAVSLKGITNHYGLPLLGSCELSMTNHQ